MKYLLSFTLLVVSYVAAAQIELPAYDSALMNVFYNTTGRYTYCFNPENRTPTWVAYKLTAADVGGGAGRANSFYADQAVINRGYICATNGDYYKSGYDKGHLLPSADRSATVAQNKTTFLFGNIAPQTPDLNRITWRLLEEHIRKLTSKNDTIYVICGTITAPDPPKIGSGVAVPSLFFKAYAVRRGGGYEKTGFVMPNSTDLGSDFNRYKVSIDSIENLTKLRLFYIISPKNCEIK